MAGNGQPPFPLKENMDYTSNKVLPFDYGVTVVLTSGQQTVQTLTLAADSVFELHLISSSSSVDAVGNVTPSSFDVSIEDLSTGRKLSNIRIPQRVLNGTANAGPYRFIRPVEFAPNANLQFDFLETSAGGNTVRLYLRGYKLFGQIQ